VVPLGYKERKNSFLQLAFSKAPVKGNRILVDCLVEQRIVAVVLLVVGLAMDRRFVEGWSGSCSSFCYAVT